MLLASCVSSDKLLTVSGLQFSDPSGREESPPSPTCEGSIRDTWTYLVRTQTLSKNLICDLKSVRKHGLNIHVTKIFVRLCFDLFAM